MKTLTMGSYSYKWRWHYPFLCCSFS